MEARYGDIVVCQGSKVTIGLIYQQDFYERDGWEIEFLDTKGNYHNWKQWTDGGHLIPNGEPFLRKTKQGYEILALIFKENKENGKKNYIMIAHKPTNFNDEYVLGVDYDATDGTWGYGIYTNSYEGALKELAKRID